MSHVRCKARKDYNLWVDWRPSCIICKLKVEDGQEGRDGEPDRVLANEPSRADPMDRVMERVSRRRL
jgi:hypothetical protein